MANLQNIYYQACSITKKFSCLDNKAQSENKKKLKAIEIPFS
jgi:hypothetical protein